MALNRPDGRRHEPKYTRQQRDRENEPPQTEPQAWNHCRGIIARSIWGVHDWEKLEGFDNKEFEVFSFRFSVNSMHEPAVRWA
jgi:hypothetical protein